MSVDLDLCYMPATEIAGRIRAGSLTATRVVENSLARIAAVSHSYGTGGKLRFALLAGDDSFRTGKNDVRMFVVTGATAKPRLQELQVTLTR